MFTRPGVNGIVRVSPFEFLDAFVSLMPPRKHRHQYLEVCAPDQMPGLAALALTIGNSGNCCDAAVGGYADGGHTPSRDHNSRANSRLPHRPPHPRPSLLLSRIHARQISREAPTGGPLA
jgi:hypothetical protein